MVGLNGTPLNGSRLEAVTAGEPVIADESPWPPDAGSWPEAVPDEWDVERARLEREIAAAHARAAAARQRAIDRDTELHAVLRQEVVASQNLLAGMEREHQGEIDRIRAEADAEVQRILAHARQLVTDRGIDAQ